MVLVCMYGRRMHGRRMHGRRMPGRHMPGRRMPGRRMHGRRMHAKLGRKLGQYYVYVLIIPGATNLTRLKGTRQLSMTEWHDLYTFKLVPTTTYVCSGLPSTKNDIKTHWSGVIL